MIGGARDIQIPLELLYLNFPELFNENETVRNFNSHKEWTESVYQHILNKFGIADIKYLERLGVKYNHEKISAKLRDAVSLGQEGSDEFIKQQVHNDLYEILIHLDDELEDKIQAEESLVVKLNELITAKIKKIEGIKAKLEEELLLKAPIGNWEELKQSPKLVRMNGIIEYLTGKKEMISNQYSQAIMLLSQMLKKMKDFMIHYNTMMSSKKVSDDNLAAAGKKISENGFPTEDNTPEQIGEYMSAFELKPDEIADGANNWTPHLINMKTINDYLFENDLYNPVVSVTRVEKKRELGAYCPHFDTFMEGKMEGDTLLIEGLKQKDESSHTKLLKLINATTSENPASHSWTNGDYLEFEPEMIEIIISYLNDIAIHLPLLKDDLPTEEYMGNLINSKLEGADASQSPESSEPSEENPVSPKWAEYLDKFNEMTSDDNMKIFLPEEKDGEHSWSKLNLDQKKKALLSIHHLGCARKCNEKTLEFIETVLSFIYECCSVRNYYVSMKDDTIVNRDALIMFLAYDVMYKDKKDMFRDTQGFTQGVVSEGGDQGTKEFIKQVDVALRSQTAGGKKTIKKKRKKYRKRKSRTKRKATKKKITKGRRNKRRYRRSLHKGGNQTRVYDHTLHEEWNKANDEIFFKRGATEGSVFYYFKRIIWFFDTSDMMGIKLSYGISLIMMSQSLLEDAAADAASDTALHYIFGTNAVAHLPAHSSALLEFITSGPGMFTILLAPVLLGAASCAYVKYVLDSSGRGHRLSFKKYCWSSGRIKIYMKITIDAMWCISGGVQIAHQLAIGSTALISGKSAAVAMAGSKEAVAAWVILGKLTLGVFILLIGGVYLKYHYKVAKQMQEQDERVE
jgi:hypothetical protein